MQEIKTTAIKLGIDAALMEMRRPDDIAPAFEALEQGSQAGFVCNDGLVNANHARINAWQNLSVCVALREAPAQVKCDVRRRSIRVPHKIDGCVFIRTRAPAIFHLGACLGNRRILLAKEARVRFCPWG
jgi:hypothetical protein